MLRSGSFAFRPATRGRSGLLVAALALVLFYCADSHPAPRFKLEQRGDFAPSISIADVADAAFLPLPGGVPAFGQRDAPVWLRISVESSGPFVLEVGYPQLDSVTVYYRDRGGWHLAELGDTLPYSTRPLDSNYYAVPFQTMPPLRI